VKPKADKTEKVIRLGCGALLGLIVGFFVGIRLFFTHGNNNQTAFVIFVILLVVIFGFLALIKGDGFWESLVTFLKR